MLAFNKYKYLLKIKIRANLKAFANKSLQFCLIRCFQGKNASRRFLLSRTRGVTEQLA